MFIDKTANGRFLVGNVSDVAQSESYDSIHDALRRIATDLGHDQTIVLLRPPSLTNDLEPAIVDRENRALAASIKLLLERLSVLTVWARSMGISVRFEVPANTRINQAGGNNNPTTGPGNDPVGVKVWNESVLLRT